MKLYAWGIFSKHRCRECDSGSILPPRKIEIDKQIIERCPFKTGYIDEYSQILQLWDLLKFGASIRINELAGWVWEAVKTVEHVFKEVKIAEQER